MTGYNGHPSWAYWNVALWIGNDETLYRLALACIANTKTRRDAAAAFLRHITPEIDAAPPVHAVVIPTTPDGARFTQSAVVHAMRGLES